MRYDYTHARVADCLQGQAAIAKSELGKSCCSANQPNHCLAITPCYGVAKVMPSAIDQFPAANPNALDQRLSCGEDPRVEQAVFGQARICGMLVVQCHYIRGIPSCSPVAAWSA